MALTRYTRPAFGVLLFPQIHAIGNLRISSRLLNTVAPFRAGATECQRSVRKSPPIVVHALSTLYDRAMDLVPEISAYILAGGKSTRMGADKAFVLLNGR